MLEGTAEVLRKIQGPKEK